MHGKLSVFVENQIADHIWNFWILEIHTGDYLYMILSRIFSVLESKDIVMIIWTFKLRSFIKDGNDFARF